MVGPDRSEWDEVLENLEERRRRVAGHGRRRAAGEAPRRRASSTPGRASTHLLDPGSFQELGTLVGGDDAPADAVVMGSGRIDGRPVMVAAEDFTVKAGHDQPGRQREAVPRRRAGRHRPGAAGHDARGRRLPRRRRGHARTPTDLLAQAQCSGRVPLVTAVLGASAGHGALVAPMSDFTVMSRHASIFTAGPPVVLESMGETITKEDLGGPGVAVPSGLIHNVADDDAGALDLVRAYLRYFPSSAWSYPPDVEPPTTVRASSPRSSTSCRATVGASTTCARCSTSCSTPTPASRCSPTSAGRSSARSPASAGTPSRSSPTSRRCSPARSTPTAPTRPRTSSPSPTRSTCR